MITLLKRIIIIFILLVPTTSLLHAKAEDEFVQSRPQIGVETIAEIFPDPELAAQVASIVSDGNVDVILTQELINLVEHLSLYNIEVADLTGIGYLTSLTYLEIYSDVLTEIPTEIANLTSLQYLYLSAPLVQSLPDEIGQLVNLLTFDFSGCSSLRFLPETISNWTQLTWLHSFSSGLEALPNAIGQLVSLSALDVQHAKITSLPDCFDQLTNLRIVKLNHNMITTLPASIGDLQANIIELQFNLLTNLPPEVINLSKNTGLMVYGNLLPNNIEEELKQLGVKANISAFMTNKIELINEETILSIYHANDIKQLDYSSIIQLESGNEVSNALPFELVNLVDENMNPVQLSDYFLNDVVKKSGRVYANIQVQTPGILEQISENAFINQYIRLDFIPTFYQLSFNLNGGEGVTPMPQQLVEGDFVSQIDNPSRIDYEFKGWNTSLEGNGMMWSSAIPMPNHDVSLFAIWEKKIKEVNLDDVYVLSFNLNGATGIIPSPQSILAGAYAKAVSHPLRFGYTFLGWNRVNDGSGDYWNFNTSIMPMENVTLYAIWKPNDVLIHEYNVTFDLNGGTGFIANQKNVFGQKIVKATDPMRAGYRFKGWNTLKNGAGLDWDFNVMTMPDNDLILYAQWEKQSLPQTGYYRAYYLLGGLFVVGGYLIGYIHNRKEDLK